ncbi:unnamed protein product [Onchocerca flexuosa]|uniref:Autophagy-related protein 101 n=1 Tax=Onchocerca flexuosa TaxID=387005 RepID=A0A183HSZ9_9BILA|nr:unnamed protein product [Onchocerca flexuosa]
MILQSSFSSTFRPSSSDEWAASRAPATDPTPEWKRKLEEAAEAVNRQVAASINSDCASHEGILLRNESKRKQKLSWLWEDLPKFVKEHVKIFYGQPMIVAYAEFCILR